MSKRVLLRLLLCVLLLFAVKQSLNLAFGWILEDVFARGTGCEVALYRPRISFFPLRGTIENAMIRHRSEPSDAGFRSRRISIRLHFLPLFRKELLLTDLELDGASAKSDGTQTGFIQTFAFLFPPKDPNAPPPDESAFSRWLKTWAFHVATIRIRSEDRPNQLIIRFKEQTFSWDRVAVEFDEQDWDPKKPYDLRADGSNFRLQPDRSPRLVLGEFSGLGEIGLGRLFIREASVLQPDDPVSRASGWGEIILAEPGRYDISIDASLRDPFLSQAFGDFSLRPADMPRHAVINSRLTGKYMEPEVKGAARLEFGPGAILPGRPECGLRDIEAAFYADTKSIRVNEVKLEDLTSSGEMEIKLNPERSLHGQFEVALDRDRRWIKDCFLKAASKDDASLEQALSDSLSDSTTTIKIGGALEPLDLRLAVASDMSIADKNVQTRLVSEMRVTDDLFVLKLTEQGVVPQIQSDVQPATASDQSVSQTTFRRALHSNVDVDLSVNLDTGVTDIRKLELRRYPAARLLARVSPFMGADTYRIVRSFPKDTSLVEVDAAGRYDFHAQAGSLNGKFGATDLNLFGVPVTRLSVPFTANAENMQVKNLLVETLEGSLRGELETNFTSGALRGGLTATRLELASLPWWQNASTDWHTLIDGGFKLTGTIRDPVYDGSLTLETAQRGIANTVRRSRLDVRGDRLAVRASGSLLDGSADLAFTYPFDEKAGTELELSLQARDLPLDYLFGEIHEPAQSILSGNLRYHGPRYAPLLGGGTFSIHKLRIIRDDFTVEQSGTLEASVQNGRLQFTKVRFRADEKEIALTGYVDNRDGWQATLGGSWELGALILAGEMLEQVSGDVKMDLAIRGPLFDPELRGPLRLEDGAVSFPLGQTIVGVNDLVVEAEFRGDELRIDRIRGLVGGSAINGTGLVRDVFNPALRTAKADFAFEHVVLEPVEHLTMDLDGRLELISNPESPPLLSGELLLRGGQYEDIVKMSQVLKSITRAIGVAAGSTSVRTVRRETDGRSLRFDIAFSALSGFLIETNIVEAELRANLNLTGSIDQPLLEGKIDAVEGAFGLQAKEFELVSGQLLFSSTDESLDPRVAILGESTAISRTGEEHHVRLAIGGTLTKPEVNFTSDSGLRQEEILSMVGFSASIQPLEILRGGEKTRSFAELINPTTGVSLQERLAGLTKFSSVQIDTGLSPTTGEFVPRLIAKRPLFRGVDLELQSELAGNQASSFDLNYPLTPYLSLIGGWRTRPVTTDANTGSGSLSVGLHYRTTFPGFRLLSPELRKAIGGEQQ